MKYGLSRTAKTICPESLTAATAVTRNIFCVVRKTKPFIYEYASGKLTERTTQTAYKCSDTQIGFTRSDSVLKGDTGNKQYMISDRKLKRVISYLLRHGRMIF